MRSAETAPLFGEGGVSTIRLIGYLALAIIVMVVDHQARWLEQIRAKASLLIEPAYRVAALPSDVARSVTSAVSSQQQLVDENRELRQSLLLAQVRLNRLNTLSAQNQRLQGLLEAQKRLGMSVQLARLVDVDLDPSRRRIVIDAGSNQGASVGQPVIDAFGLMGQIVEVLPNTSVAMLITDPSHATPVTIERTGMRTIAVGNKQSGDLLELSNIPTSADVQVGDKLITSGLGGRFPAGFPVGEIREVSNDKTGMFASALAQPAARIHRSSEVLLLHDLPQAYGPPEPINQDGPPSDLAGTPDTAPNAAPDPAAGPVQPAQPEPNP